MSSKAVMTRFFLLREASAHDVPAMARCRAADTVAGPADPRMEAYFNGLYHPQQALAARIGYVALADDNVIGYIAGHRTERHGCAGEVEYLFVAPAHRRQGVATALMRRLAEWFQAHEAQKVCVDVNPDSPAGRPFYESTGAGQLKGPWYAWEDIRALLR